MSAAARAGPRGPYVRGGYAAPLLPAEWARLIAFAPLAAYCALQWGRMLEPARPAPMLAAAAVATATGLALRRARGAWLAAVAVASVVAALLVAGIAPRLLWPGGWSELLADLGSAFGDLPATNVPYRGTDEWSATVLVLLGVLIAVLAAWLAFAPRASGRPRGPAAAAVALAVLFTVPAVEASVPHPWLTGIPLAILLCAFLRLERVERHGAPVALGVVVIAGLAAAAAAPRLDVARPIIDPDALARSLSPARGLTFSWNHSYGPLNWPRTGREVLRIQARTPSYWKVENLSTFDGLHWVQPRELGPTAPEASMLASRPTWRSEIHVRVRALTTRLFVGAGTTLDIEGSPRIPLRNAPGTFRTGPRPLRRGHTYDAVVWTPRPSRRDLRSARGHTPGWTWPYLRIDLPPAQGGPVIPRPRSSALHTPEIAQIAFPAFGTEGMPTVEPVPPGAAPRPAQRVLEGSAYGGVYRLAQRLLAGTGQPYDYVERVLDLLSHGYAYSETPPRSAVPLADFLLRDKEGYCQQFSGAMALLLRMGGVPARVSTGFSPGTLDRTTGEYVVRDTDAHSWVEAFIAPYGWITLDPTPPVGPARLTPSALSAAPAYQLGAPAGVLAAPERTGDRGIDHGSAERGFPVVPVAGAGAAFLALLAVPAFVLWRRGRRDTRPAADAALAELYAALARTGRGPQPGLTLQVMLRRFRDTPAEPYLRTLEAARFGGADVAPTRAMRAALRRELTLGLGPVARLGAWRAMPPFALRHASRAGNTYPDAP
jgi:transglutaminase-like putative cysteine protease